MNVKILSVKLIDFRSFEEEEIFLDDITAVVGANNVGKSNILKAIELFSPGMSIEPARDLRRGSARVSPEIIYTLALTGVPKDTRLNFQIPEKILVEKTVSDWILFSVDSTPLEDVLVNEQYYKNGTDAEITIGEVILQPGKIISVSLLDDTLKQQLSPIVAEEKNNLIRIELNDFVRGILPSILNIWSPKDEDFISEDNSIDQLISTPSLPLAQILTKSFQKDPSAGNYQEVLPKAIASEIETFCQNITEAANKLFNENWHFKPPIKLRIAAREASLKVFFDQGGAGHLEPSFSSDGLIWLISFFIRLGMSDIENSIILLDQPGEKLYPGGQKDLVRIIESLGEKNQLIYSTHSPFMITKKRIGRNVRIVDKHIDSNGNQIGFSKINNQIKQVDIRQSDLLTTALGFSWTDFIPVGDFNVLMEGKLDAAVVINTERQKSIKFGKADIDFSRAVVRGVGKASYINEEAKKIKIDDKKVLGIFDSDWSTSTPDLEDSEKIKLGDIHPDWSDVEDLIPKDFFKKIFQGLATKYSKPFQYTVRLDGPGRGKKLKIYLRKKAAKLNKDKDDLVNEAEMRMIDFIETASVSGTDLPKSFYKLNSKIIQKLAD